MLAHRNPMSVANDSKHRTHLEMATMQRPEPPIEADKNDEEPHVTSLPWTEMLYKPVTVCPSTRSKQPGLGDIASVVSQTSETNEYISRMGAEDCRIFEDSKQREIFSRRSLFKSFARRCHGEPRDGAKHSSAQVYTPSLDGTFSKPGNRDASVSSASSQSDIDGYRYLFGDLPIEDFGELMKQERSRRLAAKKQARNEAKKDGQLWRRPSKNAKKQNSIYRNRKWSVSGFLHQRKLEEKLRRSADKTHSTSSLSEAGRLFESYDDEETD